MKWIALIIVLLGSIGCASGDRAAPAFTPAPIEFTAASAPALRRSVELAPTITATSIAPTSTPAPTAQPQPTSQAAVPDCPPPPAPIGTQTQAAVQHFEHGLGLMFWLQERAEIWVLIDLAGNGSILLAHTARSVVGQPAGICSQLVASAGSVSTGARFWCSVANRWQIIRPAARRSGLGLRSRTGLRHHVDLLSAGLLRSRLHLDVEVGRLRTAR